MRGVAPLRAAQHVPAFALRRHAAAGAVHERHHAVDVRIVVKQAGTIDLLGDEFGDARRAVHRGEHADIVARAGLAVRPHIALEGGAQLRRQQLVVLGGLGEAVVAREIVQRDVLHMHPVARRDRLRGKADDLAVFAHRLVLRDGRDRHFVAARNALARGDAASASAERNLVDRDYDVVVRRETNGAGIGHGSLLIRVTNRIEGFGTSRRARNLKQKSDRQTRRSPYCSVTATGLAASARILDNMLHQIDDPVA